MKPQNETTTNATHTPESPLWGAYRENGKLEAILSSESEAYFYVRNRGHMHGGDFFRLEPAASMTLLAAAPDLLAALENCVHDLETAAIRIGMESVNPILKGGWLCDAGTNLRKARTAIARAKGQGVQS